MDDQFLATIHRIIEDNIDNEKFSVEDLAQHVGLSRSMLHRKLKMLTGKSSIDLITETRLTKAKEMLENNVATASEIAYKVGFSDPNYFYKVFKKHFDVLPGDVRKKGVIIPDHILKDKKGGIPGSPKSNNLKIITKTAALVVIIILTAYGIFYLISNREPPEKSLAVLPLRNLTGVPENNYFIDGMQDALIGELGRIKSLRVISRTSTLRYRDSNMLLSDIAKELNVNTIVEGSVQCLGDSLCFIVQVIDVFPEESHLLANKYHDGMENVLKMQSSAVRDIAQKIKINLTEGEDQNPAKQRKVDPETYKTYLMGMSYINQGTTESFEKGISYLHMAIKRDPTDPFAYAGLALGYASRGHALIAPAESFRTAEAAANKALRIDPASDEAYTALAILYLYKFCDWPRAKTAFENALIHNLNNEIAHFHFAWYYVLFGEMEKSIYHAKMAVTLEPYSALYNASLALLYCFDKEYDRAEFWAGKALELNKDIIFGKVVMGWIYLEKKQYQKALEIHEQLPKTRDYYLNFLGYTYIKTGHRDKALDMWNELEKDPDNDQVNPACKGLLAGMLGYHDRAFELLNEACDKKIYPIIHIETFPSADFIRNDPRYYLLLQKMDLPDTRPIFASRSTKK